MDEFPLLKQTLAPSEEAEFRLRDVPLVLLYVGFVLAALCTAVLLQVGLLILSLLVISSLIVARVSRILLLALLKSRRGPRASDTA